METQHGKLVRDGILEIIEDAGGIPTFRVLDDDGEFTLELTLKLQEEAQELTENPSLDELVDVKEVFLAICRALGFSPGEVEEARLQKARARGGFANRIYLESVKE